MRTIVPQAKTVSFHRHVPLDIKPCRSSQCASSSRVTATLLRREGWCGRSTISGFTMIQPIVRFPPTVDTDEADDGVVRGLALTPMSS
jgi:hypothetical protein